MRLSTDETGVTSTERARAIAEQLVARHGVLTRQAVLAEGVPGGFASIYPVLKALEEAGRIRRGYFVAGLGGSQFAQPGAVERLRALREGSRDDTLPAAILAATDPANPYGAAIPWPRDSAARPMRAAGAYVAIVDGSLAAFIARGEREVTTFLPNEEPARSRTAQALAGAITRWASTSGRINLGWTTVDGLPIARSSIAPFLSEAGFRPFGSTMRLIE